jgi:hypothetical protein
MRNIEDLLSGDRLQKLFWDKVEKDIRTGCWYWRRGKSSGYGRLPIHRDGKKVTVYAHRFSWALTRRATWRLHAPMRTIFALMLLAVTGTGVMAAEKLTNPVIIDNLSRAVERGGFGCPRVQTAMRMSYDDYNRVQFMVVCEGMSFSGYYRVTVPPDGPALVKAEPWLR